MISRSAGLWLLIALIVLLAPTWVRAHAAECKAVHATYLLDEEEFISPCAEFDFCLRAPVVGTFNGMMTFQWDSSFASTFDPWSEGSEFNLYHGYELIETKHGTVTAIERGLFGFDTGFVTSVIEIAGGTGTYEGASGRLAWFAKGMTPAAYYLEGEICTPSKEVETESMAPQLPFPPRSRATRAPVARGR